MQAISNSEITTILSNSWFFNMSNPNAYTEEKGIISIFSAQTTKQIDKTFW